MLYYLNKIRIVYFYFHVIAILKPLFLNSRNSLHTMKAIYLDQKYKKSLIETLLFRWFLIFSYYTLLHLEIENLREIFKKNSYPSGFLEQSIKSFLNKIHVPKKVIPTMSKKELFVMTSRNDVINLGLKLRTWFKNSLPQCNIKIIFKSTNRLSSLFHFKDVIPKELQSHIAYRFSYGNCDVT